jgi:peroxiredoxin
MVRKGDKAQAFALPAKPGEMIDVGTDIGTHKVVLLFFPFAYSGVCTAEMCHMRDNFDAFKKLDAKVYGISVDSPFVTDRWRQDEKIPFPILSDFNKEVASQYGVLHEQLKIFKGVAKRAAFVIGKDGKVVYAWVTEDPSQQVKFDEIEAALAS